MVPWPCPVRRWRTRTPAWRRPSPLSPSPNSAPARRPRGGGWVAAADLAAGGDGLEAFLAWDDTQVRRDYGQQGRPDVIASFGLHRYAWPTCLLITVPWFLHRRVPRYP